MGTVRSILKRDGVTTQDFDINKLRSAIEAAWVGVKPINEKSLTNVVKTVLSSLTSEVVGVETVQNAVELALMYHQEFAVAKAYILYRAHRTELRQMTDKAVDSTGISDYIHAGKYARYVPELLRREVYEETVARVEGMHLHQFPHMETEIRDAFKLVYAKRVLPSMRSMQFGGAAIKANHNRIYNCSFTLIDRFEAFSEALFLLLSGCGVGYSIQFDHVDKMPAIGYIDTKQVEHHVVGDTIEGWADALRTLFGSFQRGTNLEFSYHQIRAAGIPLKTSGGRAPGHLKLKDSLERIRTVLLAAQGRKLRPIEAHRILCHSADAVLSGGIRRSAMIALFSYEDSEMMYAKTGAWYSSDPWFANANNSVVLKRDEVKKKQFKRIFQMTKQWGEPGFYFTADYDYGTNPCFHPDTRLWTSKGYEKVGDLFKLGGPNKVIRDVRVGKGDIIHGALDRGSFRTTVLGVNTAEATPVFLTQRKAPIFKLTTEHGHQVRVTGTHDFPTPQGRRKLQDLKSGDVLLLPSGEGTFGSGGTLDEGFLLGAYVGDGTSDTGAAYLDLWEEDFSLKSYMLDSLNNLISKVPTYGTREDYGPVRWQTQVVSEDVSVEKVRAGAVRFSRWLDSVSDNEQRSSLKERVPEAVWTGSRDFVIGYLRGLFATDGTVLLGGSGKKATLSLRLTQSNDALLRDVQMLLGMFGVQSRVYLRREAGYRDMPTHKTAGDVAPYWCEASYELVVNRPNIITFMERIGLVGPKAEILESRMGQRGSDCRKPERFITTVLSIEPAGESDVYCLTQDETNCVIANGLVTGQCAEIGLNPKLTIDEPLQIKLLERGIRTQVGDHYTGWAFCNLCEINAAKFSSYEDFEAAAKAATLIGTLQAAYTQMPYLGWVSEEIAKQEALLGIGMTGMMDAPHISLNPEYQTKVALKIKQWNAEFAAKLGIRPASRTTCVKPSGTTSLELGCVGSGIHAHHARRYIRRVTADELEPMFQHFKSVNPSLCQRKPDGKWVIEFPVQAPEGATIKEDLSAIQFLDMVKSTQQNWVVPGTADSIRSPGLNHNVSNTVTVGPDEWDEVANYLWLNRDLFTGVSLLSVTGDKDFAFSPNEAVITPADEKHWRELVLAYQPVDYSSLIETEDGTSLTAEPACAGGLCSIV